MKDISFSIIIPAFNAAASIRATLESCLHQSLPPHEVIVVNDASTDETVDMIRMQFGDAVKLISMQENLGPSAARNAGVAAASGDFIAFLDADDGWHPEKLARIQKLLQSRPDIDFLFHTFSIGKLQPAFSESMMLPHRFPLWKLLLRNSIATPCAIIRRNQMLHFDERMRHMEDYDLFLRIAVRRGVWRIAAPLTFLGRPVLSAGGQSSNRWKMRQGEIKAWWHLIRMRPMYWPVFPILLLLSLGKHGIKWLLSGR